MRVLFVVPNVPSFIRTRPFNFIRELSRIHKVSVVCVATNESDHQFASDLRACCENVEIFRVSRFRSAWNCVRALFSSKSLRCAYFYSPAVRERVRSMLAKGEVDLLHAEHLKCMPMVEDALGTIPTVFDAVDCVSMFERKRRQLIRNPFLRLFSFTEERKMARWEAKAGTRFGAVLISSPIDKQHYPATASSRERIHVIPNGVDFEYFKPEHLDCRMTSIVFCAKLDYFPNEDAVIYFARSIWPILRSRRPQLEFHIVGSRPPRSIMELNGANNIRVTGFVPDIRPYLRQATVAVCPIRVRAGIQNKILEAMAAGVPIIATPICCPGLSIEPGKHLLVANTPEEFVSAVELVLDNSSLRTKLIQAGRNYVERSHSWKKSGSALCDIYAHVLADAKGTHESIMARGVDHAN